MSDAQRRRLQKLELMIDSAGRPLAVIEIEIVDVFEGRPVLTRERLRWDAATGAYEPIPSGYPGSQGLDL